MVKRAEPPTALVRVERGEVARPAPRGRRALMDLWLEGKKGTTLRAYRDDVEQFAAYLGLKSGEEAAEQLVRMTHAEANEAALGFRNAMVDKGLSPATINRRLSSLRSLVDLANTVGHVPWTLSIKNVRAEQYRDTKGPGVDAVRKMLKAANGMRHAARNKAIIHLLYDMALRRGEVAELDLEHVNVDEGWVSVLGKGRRERERFTMPDATTSAIAAWIAERGRAPGSLFGIATDTIYLMVRTLGDKAGVGHVRPHGLRHSAITDVLTAVNGNVVEARAFSRHKKVETVLRYNDNRLDSFASLANRVAIDEEEP